MSGFVKRLVCFLVFSGVGVRSEPHPAGTFLPFHPKHDYDFMAGSADYKPGVIVTEEMDWRVISNVYGMLRLENLSTGKIKEEWFRNPAVKKKFKAASEVVPTTTNGPSDASHGPLHVSPGVQPVSTSGGVSTGTQTDGPSGVSVGTQTDGPSDVSEATQTSVPSGVPEGTQTEGNNNVKPVVSDDLEYLPDFWPGSEFVDHPDGSALPPKPHVPPPPKPHVPPPFVDHPDGSALPPKPHVPPPFVGHPDGSALPPKPHVPSPPKPHPPRRATGNRGRGRIIRLGGGERHRRIKARQEGKTRKPRSKPSALDEDELRRLRESAAMRSEDNRSKLETQGPARNKQTKDIRNTRNRWGNAEKDRKK